MKLLLLILKWNTKRLDQLLLVKKYLNELKIISNFNVKINNVKNHASEFNTNYHNKYEIEMINKTIELLRLLIDTNTTNILLGSSSYTSNINNITITLHIKRYTNNIINSLVLKSLAGESLRLIELNLIKPLLENELSSYLNKNIIIELKEIKNELNDLELLNTNISEYINKNDEYQKSIKLNNIYQYLKVHKLDKESFISSLDNFNQDITINQYHKLIPYQNINGIKLNINGKISTGTRTGNLTYEKGLFSNHYSQLKNNISLLKSLHNTPLNTLQTNHNINKSTGTLGIKILTNMV